MLITDEINSCAAIYAVQGGCSCGSLEGSFSAISEVNVVKQHGQLGCHFSTSNIQLKPLKKYRVVPVALLNLAGEMFLEKVGTFRFHDPFKLRGYTSFHIQFFDVKSCPLL